ncbi:hypothetical protein M0805_004912 [Coniferiporia weirii]|nr:hypothetical protein M0805_004912 [Coniferiporia weirii]
MSRGGYAPLPDSLNASHTTAEEEMERAFESDDGDQQETTPLTVQYTHPRSTTISPTQSQEAPSYDFEREYDLPPPGSPPASALGNTNGIIPSPSAIPRQESRPLDLRPSFFRRAVGALLPQHYTRVPTSDGEAAARARGSGIENDGVFANVLARSTRERADADENGDIHVMPEETQKDVPPSYAAAQADAVPPYWETTVHAPALGGADDLLIDGLHAGTIFSFAWNFLISISFQFVGFMLTYLLHTTHAAKYGSRAGLGVTLIQYGLYSRSYGSDGFGGGSDSDADAGEPTMTGQAMRLARRGLYTFSPRTWMSTSPTPADNTTDEPMQNTYMHDWLSFLLMTIGWFLLLSSVLGFARVKRWERSVHTPTPPPVLSREDIERDQELRERLQQVFGFDLEEEEEQHAAAAAGRTGANESITAEEANIRRDLRAMGLI